MEVLPQKTQGILFDLDGTLVDSIPDIAHGANLTLQTLGLPEADFQALKTWVGNGSRTLMKRALTKDFNGEPDSELLARALPIFFDHYADHVFVHSALYPGVQSTLESLDSQGFKLACVTNKPLRHTQALLAESGLARWFASVVAGDSTPHVKPHPEPLLEACRALDLDPSQCLMVGDSMNDIKAAQAAAMPVVALSYGYNQGIDLNSGHPDVLIDNFSELLNWVCKSTKS